jgi:2-phosphosulfolactate phosphatase
MTPPITHRSGIAGAKTAEGATLVIDTFRAFSTAAYLFDAGVARLILTDTLDQARLTAGAIDEALLCGENEGIQPADFDLGNSPAQVIERTDLTGRTIVMRTSAGSRSVVAAASAGASPIYATSLVVASATAAAVTDEPAVTIVAEDDATANLLEALLTKTPHRTETMIEVLLAGTGAKRLLTTPSIDDRDLDLCLAVDAFDFPMEVTSETGLLVLKRG